MPLETCIVGEADNTEMRLDHCAAYFIILPPRLLAFLVTCISGHIQFFFSFFRILKIHPVPAAYFLLLLSSPFLITNMLSILKHFFSPHVV